MFYPANIEQKIDFTVIRDELRRHCSSPLGKERVDQLHMLTDFQQIDFLLRQADQMQQAVNDPELNFPRGTIYDVREALARVRIEGLFLDEAELFQLRQTLDYACQLEDFFRTLDTVRYDILRQLTANPSRALSEILRAIDRVIDKYGHLSDSASPELARIRRELLSVQGSVGRVLRHILNQAKSDGLIDKDAAPTLREGRLVIPVPPAYKRKIGGIVHDESATGKTVFVEPQQVVEANNRIRELESAERRERARILIELTNRLRPCVPDILASEELLAEVDLLQAKVQLARSLNATRPTLVDTETIDWQSARHPVLYLRFTQQHKDVVPLSIRLERDRNRILIISGANAGGKSVCLKTVALIQYMAQCGLLVPLAESSTMGVFQQLMLDIGDAQSIEDDLSTYSGHLRNMKAFVAQANAHTLILIDELGGGTEPLIGGAIAEAVLTQLYKQDVFGVITTHYTNLKHLAEQTPGMVNGAMLYDRGQMQPLFQLSIGQAGSSFAIEIAKQTGLPPTIIQHATELVGEEHIDYDRQLQDIARDKRYWANKRQQIRLKEKHLEERIATLDEQLSGVKQQKRDILDQARKQAEDILQQSNATIERTIREIKESKADKERTKAARKKVEAMKQKVATPASKPSTSAANSSDTPKVLRDLRDLKVLKGQSLEQPSSLAKHSNSVHVIHQRKVNFERTLDLRGMRVDEALEALIAYMDDAIMVNAGEVTILHGTGTGALKQLTRDYLSNLNHQRRKRGQQTIDFGDGDVNHGGAGITLVQL